MTPSRQTLGVAVAIARHFERIGVPYYVTGSIASSLYGEPRATRDVDIVADLARRHVEPLIAALGEDYYADPAMIEDAIGRRGHFNVLELRDLVKADVFLPAVPAAAGGPFARARRIDLAVAGAIDGALTVAAPEDIVIAKLAWYRAGSCVSDQQWRDIVRLLAIQAGALDEGLLDREAAARDLADLLARARADAAP